MAGPSDEKKPWRPPSFAPGLRPAAKPSADGPLQVFFSASRPLCPFFVLIYQNCAALLVAHFLFFLFTKNISERGGGHFPTKARALHGGHKFFAAFSPRDKLFGGLAADFTFVKFLKK